MLKSLTISALTYAESARNIIPRVSIPSSLHEVNLRFPGSTQLKHNSSFTKRVISARMLQYYEGIS
jgi:hypothetical protein